MSETKSTPKSEIPYPNYSQEEWRQVARNLDQLDANLKAEREREKEASSATAETPAAAEPDSISSPQEYAAGQTAHQVLSESGEWLADGAKGLGGLAFYGVHLPAYIADVKPAFKLIYNRAKKGVLLHGEADGVALLSWASDDTSQDDVWDEANQTYLGLRVGQAIQVRFGRAAPASRVDRLCPGTLDPGNAVYAVAAESNGCPTQAELQLVTVDQLADLMAN